MERFEPDADRTAESPRLCQATERLVESVARLGNAAIPAALLREIRAHKLAEQATVWTDAGPHWVPIRSLGAPTPSPLEAREPGWRASGAEVFSLGPITTLVTTAPSDCDSEERETRMDLLSALAATASLLDTSCEMPYLDEESVDGITRALPPPLPGIPEDPERDRPDAA